MEVKGPHVGLSSRANARDLRKISPGACPEHAEGVEMTMRGLRWFRFKGELEVRQTSNKD